jgi:phage tail-like protein
MARGDRRDPFRPFNFELHVDGVACGGFSECKGLTDEGDAVDYREGAELSPGIRKLVGLRKYAVIVLKRGCVEDQSLWDWLRNIANGEPDRRSVTIVARDERRRPVARWRADGVWISKIEGPSLQASANEMAIESLELLHEGLTVEEVDTQP